MMFVIGFLVLYYRGDSLLQTIPASTALVAIAFG